MTHTAKSESLSDFQNSALCYLKYLQECFTSENLNGIECLSRSLLKAWAERRQVFICGNGGSAANALHIANDFHYGIGTCGPSPNLPGLRVEALTANTGILTCLANDTGYENIFAHQLMVKANAGDLLIILSGSGNSLNVVNALITASHLNMSTCAIVAYKGGRCKELADNVIHFLIDDMQIAEDAQLIVGHLCMKWLLKNKPEHLTPLNNG